MGISASAFGWTPKPTTSLLPVAESSEPVLQCSSVHTRKVNKHQDAEFLCWRGGGYDNGVYSFEAKYLDPERRLLKPEIIELDSSGFGDVLVLLRDAVSDRMRVVYINGGGACGFGVSVFV